MALYDDIKRGCESACNTTKVHTVTLYRDQLSEVVGDDITERLIGEQSGRSVAVCPRMVLAAMADTRPDE